MVFDQKTRNRNEVNRSDGTGFGGTADSLQVGKNDIWPNDKRPASKNPFDDHLLSGECCFKTETKLKWANLAKVEEN